MSSTTTTTNADYLVSWYQVKQKYTSITVTTSLAISPPDSSTSYGPVHQMCSDSCFKTDSTTPSEFSTISTL